MAVALDKVVEEVVSQAVKKLVQTVSDNVELVRGIDSEIKDLAVDIETFNARLVDASKNPRANELQLLEVVVKRFRDIVNEAQDAVRKYVAEKKKHGDKGYAKCVDKIPHVRKVHLSAGEIRVIRTKVNTIRKDHEKDLRSLMNYPIENQSHLQAGPVVEGDYVVGFDKDFETIQDRLMEPSDKLIVIPIVGIPGIGKTTFAKKIFEDPNIHDKFDYCIWVHVAQGFSRRQKFIDIQNQITKHTENFSDVSEDILEMGIKDRLENKKYFIVLDDVWEKNDWDSFKVAFPNTKGSKVLLTTRSRNVADSIGKPHSLQELSSEVSWLLLEKNVFGEKRCDNKSFEAHGRKIADKCSGLPLALVVIAGILRNSKTTVDWERVAKNPFLEINRTTGQRYHKLVMLSYDQLPHEKLKNCFLYFASFPMGHDISASKLIRLWIAEEFIPTKDEWGYPLDVKVEAQNYLNDLVDRNLVKVLKRRADGQIKICRILDSLHEFCKSEAAKKNLFHVMDDEKHTIATNTSISSRRLCFHSSITQIFHAEKKQPSCLFLSCYNKRSPFPFGEHVHSLLVSSSHKREIHLIQMQMAMIPKAFPMLRVLDIESLILSFLPNGLYGLDHLKYLAITTNLDRLPKAFKNLRELETLVLNTSKRKLEIDGGIWNMENLRHLYTNASMKLPLPPRTSSGTGSTNVHTLSTISPSSCKEEIFNKILNLKKLGVRGDLAELLEEKEGTNYLFNNIQMLDCLENLKLRGLLNEEVLAEEVLEVPMLLQPEKVLKLPTEDKFPPRLRKLTLSNTLFEWNDMQILGLMKELEVLKLDDNAFMGSLWEVSSNIVFKQLQYLRIGRTNLVTWKVATEKSFPALECLVLRYCAVLEGIPNALVHVDSLKMMELFHVSEKAINSARELHKEINGKRDMKTSGLFELSITSLPPQTTLFQEENVSTVGPDIPSTSYVVPVIEEEEDVVGFDNEAKIIKERLLGGSTDLTFISIKGMAGLGKTTLTKMVFKDQDLRLEYFPRLWVYVSRTFNRKQIFLDILSNFIKITKEFHDMSEESLALTIQDVLVSEKYFIVMDDVWSKKDWDYLKIAFPNNTKGSRVLVTTRHEKVALYIDSTCIPHQLKFLSNDESWELLEKCIFRKEKCAPPLENLGKCIAIKCNGLPLAVITIAAVLDKNGTLDEWKHVAENPFPVINQENQSYNELVKLSYDHLPFHLKDCFLYLAAFPIGHDIPAWKLIRLWIAEGFIPLMEGEYSSDLERTAEKYLEDLVDRNLLMVLRRRADGQIKTCRIHDTLHEFCKKEAATKNLFHEMDHRTKLDVNEIPRRLCVHSSILEFLKSDNKPSSEHVRSFLSYCSKEVEIPNECRAAIPKSFPLLRVMDVESLKFKLLPKELYSLYHLRFLAVSTDLKLLPARPFNNLWNMQTLVFNSSHNSLEVKADIWSMSKLRHVHSNSSMVLPPPPKSSKRSASVSTDIKTLSTISPSSCTGDIFDKTPDLQKLGIRGNLAELMDVKQGGVSLFDNLQKLDRLENLKLINYALQSNKLRSFPRAEKFPRRLRKMTLFNTAFEWKDLSALGSLDELEVLKLEDNAFRGEFCDVRSVVFKQLQYFRIGRTDLVSWTASKDSFPVLKCLFLRNCTKLVSVPVEFGEIESLKLLELYCTNKGAVKSAQKIQELKRGVNGDTKKGGFQLSVYLPEQ